MAVNKNKPNIDELILKNLFWKQFLNSKKEKLFRVFCADCKVEYCFKELTNFLIHKKKFHPEQYNIIPKPTKPKSPKKRKSTQSLKKIYATLDDNQREVIALVEQNKNIFLTGSAGTGKSYLLKTIKQVLQSKYKKESKTEQRMAVVITSTTGISADIIGGVTLNSFAGIRVYSDFPVEDLISWVNMSVESKKRWKRVKHLIIDEVSMLDGNLFDKLEQIARTVREDNRPFGGIQLILVGDFCQLSPVEREGERVRYCFESKSWPKCINKEIELKKVYRQNHDLPLLSLLQDLRYGEISATGEKLIADLQREIAIKSDETGLVQIFATNREVDYLNQKKLSLIKEQSHFYHAQDYEAQKGLLKQLIQTTLAVDLLELKVGTQVMLIANYFQEDLFNGSQGVVMDFQEGNPIVKFANGRTKTILPYKWTKDYLKGGSEIVTLASRSQIPLVLGWAITVHKSQGKTIERLKIDCQRFFAYGQMYTALSRSPSTKYLQVVNFNKNKIMTDNNVIEYYRLLQTKEHEDLPSQF